MTDPAFPAWKDAYMAWRTDLDLTRSMELAARPLPPPPPSTALEVLQIAAWKAEQSSVLPGAPFSPPTPSPTWSYPQEATLGLSATGVAKGLWQVVKVVWRVAGWYSRAELLYDTASGAYRLLTATPDTSGARPPVVYEEASGRTFVRRPDGSYVASANRSF